MAENNIKGIIVLGGHVQGLGTLRIFGRQKIPGIVIDNSRFNLAKHSNYCREFYHIKDDQLLAFLINLGRDCKYHKWMLFPSNDYQVKLLSVNKIELEKYFIVTTDQWNIIQHFYNKKASYSLVSRLNVPFPITYFPEKESDLETIDLVFPCIIKPAVMHEFYRKSKKKVFVCKNAKELKDNYRKALTIIPPEEIMVQEIIKGPSKNQFSACFLYLNGKNYVSLTACRMRQHPLSFGNATTYAEAMDIPILKKYGEKILEAAAYNGVCEVEFKLDDKDGQFKFLEVNTRTWKWHTIANKANTPFLKTFYDYLTGSSIQPTEEFRKSSYRHFLTDFPVQMQLLFRGYGYWKRRISPTESAVWAFDDLKPWFFEKLYLFHYLIKR